MFGSLFIDGKKAYTFTEEDRELTIRAVFGESGGNAAKTRDGLAVIVCMVNRWAMLLKPRLGGLLSSGAKKAGYKSFADMLDSYSQPVNPIWLNGGIRDTDPGTVTPQEERRLDIQTSPLSEFPKSIHDLVDGCFARDGYPATLADGVPPDMVGLVHFFAPCYYYAKKLRKRQRDLTPAEVDFACRTAYGSSAKVTWAQPEGIPGKGNAFYRVKATRDWTVSTVKVTLSA